MDTGRFTCFVIGEGSLPLQCARILQKSGHRILGVISADRELGYWAKQARIPIYSPVEDLYALLSKQPFDYLFSIVNQAILPAKILNLPARHAINYHDAPLPKYAGVHATTWALIHQEKEHGITWHIMAEKVDAGEILQQPLVKIQPNETVLTLNIKCYEAAIASFIGLVDDLTTGQLQPISQELINRSFFSSRKRPPQGATIEWSQSAEEIDALYRALHFLPYPNPLCALKLFLDSQFYLIRELHIESTAASAPAGTLVNCSTEGLRISTATKDINIKSIFTIDGFPIPLAEIIALYKLEVGRRLPALSKLTAQRINALNRQFVKHESFGKHIYSPCMLLIFHTYQQPLKARPTP